MKKTLLLFLMAMMGTMGMKAADYPYLTFELTDGTKASVSVSSDVAMTFSGSTLTIGSETFTLTNLSKMYFSTSDETTTGISALETADSNEIEAIYNLQGHKVSRDQMQRGVYIIKTKKGTSKITVK
ncbi:MAG: hypothetical protein E7106_05995 [Prevotella sp.]|nr:hypothetical protein [Prevotella sp.]